MQDRITRSRMVGDPPDIVISPRIEFIDMMDFDRAAEIIAAGEASVEKQINTIKNMLLGEETAIIKV